MWRVRRDRERLLRAWLLRIYCLIRGNLAVFFSVMVLCDGGESCTREEIPENITDSVVFISVMGMMAKVLVGLCILICSRRVWWTSGRARRSCPWSGARSDTLVHGGLHGLALQGLLLHGLIVVRRCKPGIDVLGRQIGCWSHAGLP